MGDAGHLGPQDVRFDHGEAVVDGVAVAGVHVAVAEECGRPVAEHRQDGRVGGDGGLPGPGVLGEGVGVAQQIDGRLVVGDQQRVDTGGDPDRGERAVRPQPPVVAVRIGGEVRAVQRERLRRLYGAHGGGGRCHDGS